MSEEFKEVIDRIQLVKDELKNDIHKLALKVKESNGVKDMIKANAEANMANAEAIAEVTELIKTHLVSHETLEKQRVKAWKRVAYIGGFVTVAIAIYKFIEELI